MSERLTLASDSFDKGYITKAEFAKIALEEGAISKDEHAGMMQTAQPEAKPNVLSGLRAIPATLGQAVGGGRIGKAAELALQALPSAMGLNPMAQVPGVQTLQAMPGRAAEAMGKAGVPPQVAAAAALPAGVAADMLPRTTGEIGLGAGGARLLGGAVDRVGGGVSALIDRLPPETREKVMRTMALKVPLSPAEMLQSRPVAEFQKMVENTPLGAWVIDKFKQGQFDAVKQARDTLLSKFGPSQGAKELGESLTKAIVGYKNALYKESKVLWDEIDELLPDGTKIPMDRTRAMAQQILDEEKALSPSSQDSALMAKLRDMAKLGLDEPAPARQMVDGVPLITGAKPPAPTKTGTWRALQHERSDLSSKMYEESAKLPPSAKGNLTRVGRQYDRLRKAMDLDEKAFSEQSGGLFYEKYQLARAATAKMKDFERGKLFKTAIRQDPEAVTRYIVRPGAVTPILNLKKSVSKSDFALVKQKFMENVLTSPLESEGQALFSPARVSNRLAHYGDDTLKAVFDPSELQAIRDVGTAGNMIGTVTRLAGTQPTGKSVLWATTGGLLVYVPSVAGRLAVLLTPPMLAKMYLSDTGRKLLTTGLRMEASNPAAAGLAARIAGFVGADQVARKVGAP